MTTLCFQWRWFTLNLANKFGVNLIEVCPGWPIDDKSTLVQVMAWQQSGDKPLPESMMTQFNGPLSERKMKSAWLACTQELKYYIHLKHRGQKWPCGILKALVQLHLVQPLAAGYFCVQSKHVLHDAVITNFLANINTVCVNKGNHKYPIVSFHKFFPLAVSNSNSAN